MTTTNPTEQADLDKPETGMSEKLQAQLAEKLMEIIESVASARGVYYLDNPDQLPNPDNVPDIISSYATKNALISGGVSLIPGPWGMVAAIPEISLLIHNQLMMIYDIAMAHGKKSVLTKELLVGVLISSMGMGATGLIILHGGEFIVKRVALRVMQQIVTLLAGKVTQQMLKAMISKWLPIVGAAAMATWANYSTKQIGKKANALLQMNVKIIDADENDNAPTTAVAEAALPSPHETKPTVSGPNFTLLKVQGLIGLLKADKIIHSEERGYIQTIIEKAQLSPAEKDALTSQIDSDIKSTVDFALYANDNDEVIGMLVDLVALAKRDGEFHFAEKIYIKQAGKLMGLTESDIQDACSSA